MTMKRPTLTPREDTARRAINTAMRALGIHDKEMAMRLGDVTRSAVQQRRAGYVKLRPEQVESMADALRLPADVFSMTPDEVLRWLADNRFDEVIAASGWLGRLSAHATA